jgi:hypothetical protein
VLATLRSTLILLKAQSRDPDLDCLQASSACAHDVVGRRFLRCRLLFTVSALLVAMLATLLWMSSRDDEVTLTGGRRPIPMHKLRALRRVRPIVSHHHQGLGRWNCPDGLRGPSRCALEQSKAE